MQALPVNQTWEVFILIEPKRERNAEKKAERGGEGGKKEGRKGKEERSFRSATKLSTLNFF